MPSRPGTDSNLEQLISAAAVLKGEYIRGEAADPWAGSPFAWIRGLPSRQVGKVGEQLVDQWCSANNLPVDRSPDSEADRLVCGRRVEIKFSSLWKTGTYTFQQIRDQNYAFVICLGISPFEAHCWIIDKDTLRKHVIGCTPQHRGQAGTDTFWIQSVNPKQPPDWLRPCGGSLEAAMHILDSWRAS